MPLSEHEQKILEEIERRLAEEDPRLVQQVSRTSLLTHASRRIRLAVLSFAIGLIMLMLFLVSLWVALAGFAVMLVSGLLVYHYLKRLSREQLRNRAARSPLGSLVSRLAERLRGHHGKSP